jgi:transposase-like protein
MVQHHRTCPRCGSEKVTTIRLPRPVARGEPPATQTGFRCMECDTQWTQDPHGEAAHRGEPES